MAVTSCKLERLRSGGMRIRGKRVNDLRREGVGGDAHGALLAAGGEEVEEILAIGVAEEDSLTVVAALGDVQPVARGSETVLAWHEGLQ